MPGAARLGDYHECPDPGPVPHVGGPILPECDETVLINNLPAARVTDLADCDGPPDAIADGSMTVLIGNLQAARMFDPTVHGGMIVEGSLDVIIGDGTYSTMVTAKALAKALAEDCGGSGGGAPAADDGGDTAVA
jgi:uncharacterized Zn-binding protein involved in type VI secretion